MKKVLTKLLLIILSMILVLSFVACDKERRSNDDDEDDDEKTSVSDKNDKDDDEDKDEDSDDEDKNAESDKDDESGDNESNAKPRPVPTIYDEDDTIDNDIFDEPVDEPVEDTDIPSSSEGQTFEEYMIAQGETTESTDETDEYSLVMKIDGNTMYITLEIKIDMTEEEIEACVDMLEMIVASLPAAVEESGFTGDVDCVAKAYDKDGNKIM